MNARPNLSLVVDDNGEVVEAETENELRVIVQKQQGTIKGWMLRCDALEKQLGLKQSTAPDSARVRDVLNHWADTAVETGWWSRRPFFKPGHLRWKTVSARLGERDDQGALVYSVEYLKTVADRALAQRKGGRVKQAFVDAKSIYLEGNLESFYEEAVDPNGRLRATLPEEFQRMSDTDLEWLVRRCDCGHFQYKHSMRGVPPEGNCPCADCDCHDFDDIHTRADEWLRRQGTVA